MIEWWLNDDMNVVTDQDIDRKEQNTKETYPKLIIYFLALRRSDSWMIFLEVVAMCLWEAGPESLSLGLSILQKYKLEDTICIIRYAY